MENIKSQLLGVLEHLEQEHLKVFIWRLNNGVENFAPIPRSRTENADRCKIVDVMVEAYTLRGAVEVTQKILKKMNQNQLAEKLGADSGEDKADTPRQFESLKLRLKQKIKAQYEKVYEGTAAGGERNLLNDIYTELCVVKDWPTRVNTEHEVVGIEAGSSRHAGRDTVIKFSEVFSGKVEKILTLGIAGIGKTISAQKFALDWAEGKSNTDIDLVFFIPFRELNVLKDEEYSLPDLLHYFYSDLQLLQCTWLFEGDCKCLFVFDGLDEFRHPLEFHQKKVSAVTEKARVNVLVTNLITGDLLPSALICITSRPAAADQIPLEHIHLVTEVQGFLTDQQKEEYFRRRLGDQADQTISHIKQQRTLYIMCYIPVFCRITCTVLQRIMNNPDAPDVVTSLTQMYTHFLSIQMETKSIKDNKTPQKDRKKLLESNRTVLLKLAELAFKQLMEGNVMFYEEDLKESSIDVTEAAVYSGIFTEIFMEECSRMIYCFVHLSFQEFLAAVYVFHCYEIKNMKDLQKLKPLTRSEKDSWEIMRSKNISRLCVFRTQDTDWSENVSLDELLKGAVNKAVESQNGHLDLFLRFLLGISLESNQSLLQGLLTPTQSRSEKTKEHIKFLIKKTDLYYVDGEECRISTESYINLFLCLSEMKDQSLSRELQEYLQSEEHSGVSLSPGQCSALAYMLLSSEEVLDELDVKKYTRSEEGYRRLIPALTVCRKAQLAGCYLTRDSCDTLCSVLQSPNSSLKELDLSNNNLQDSGVNLLSSGLKSSNCKLETLRLAGCNLTRDSCETICDILQLPNSSLKELHLSNNDLQDSGVQLISAGMKSSHCKLETLSLAGCNLTRDTCETLCSVLRSPNSSLKELDLSNNDLQDSVVQLVSAGLHCKLETLRLANCNIGINACECLGSALQSADASLKELDLSSNDMQDSGVELLSAGLKKSHIKLEKLGLSGCMVTEEGCSSLASALKSNPSLLRELDLSYNHPGESGVKLLSDLKEDPHCSLEILRVDYGGKIRIKPGLKKYAVYLTLDPNTVHNGLWLSEDRTVEDAKQYMPGPNPRARKMKPYPDHPDRFASYTNQVLSVESLTGRCYWEVQWEGRRYEDETGVAVAYRGTPRKGGTSDVRFGNNKQSWRLECDKFRNKYTVRHNHQETELPAPPFPSNRVGVYLDWGSGTLSFYTISPKTHTLTHLHTLYSRFTEPLYAGLRVNRFSSVRLCKIE